MSKELNDDGVEIWVNQFNEKSAQEFRNKVLRLAEHGDEMVIPVFIDSYGGYVDSLAKMIETMDSVPNRFVTVCMGKAMSCGAILLSHGDIRWCGKYSRIMVHNVSSGSYGDAYDLKATSDEVMRLNKVFMELVANNCGKTLDELQELIRATTCGKEIWLDPKSAFEFGIVDHIGTPKLHPIMQFAVETIPDKDRLTDNDKGIKKRKNQRRKKRVK